MTGTLLSDVVSYTREVYGYAGEDVFIISDHDNVLIVEGYVGRFPVEKSQVNIEGQL